MKRNIYFSISLLAVAVLIWQCTDKTETGNLDLKSSINSTAIKLNDAVEKIKTTPGYSILTLQGDNSVSSVTEQSTLCTDSINLADIKGIYEYKPASFNKWCYYCYDRLFKQTGNSDSLIIKMPEEKIFFPYKFHHIEKTDSVLKNNFKIIATDYHYYFAQENLFDYKLALSCILDSIKIGNLDIHSNHEKQSTYKYSALFSFGNGYGINVYTSSGDTAISSFGLSDDKGVLLKETEKKIKINGKRREKEYILTIGNIDIKRMPAKDSIEIYVSGILQKNAQVKFIDNDSIEDKSICKKRDIQITFDDGTTAKVSELIGPALTTLSGLVESMKNIYFASNVVDYIAWNIRKNNCKKN
jgi:hypothetical protein